MSTAQYIERRFRANKVYITEKQRMGHYTRFDLWCGLIVNVTPTSVPTATRCGRGWYRVNTRSLRAVT